MGDLEMELSSLCLLVRLEMIVEETIVEQRLGECQS